LYFCFFSNLRDLRQSLHVLCQLNCDETLIALQLSDILGSILLSVIEKEMTITDKLIDLHHSDIYNALLNSFNISRGNCWSLLRNYHDIDLMQTVKIISPAHTRASGHTVQSKNVNNNNIQINKYCSMLC
jgi:hypothetical protein